MLKYIFTLCLIALSAYSAVLHNAVQVSDIGISNTISEPNTSRNIGIDSNQNIFVVYHGADGVRISKSIDNGATFLPSIQITTTDAETEINISPTDKIYVAWISGGNIFISSSTDNGNSFSLPQNIGTSSSTTLHMATYNNHVYIIPRNGHNFIYSHDSGVTFSTTTVAPGEVFSDVVVDPDTGIVYVQTDDPTLNYYESNDGGVSFGTVIIPGGDVFYSTTTSIFNAQQKSIYVGGNNYGSPVDTGYKINLLTGTSSTFNLAPTDKNQGRFLATTNENHVIDAYTFGGSVFFAVSSDSGITYNTPIEVSNSSTRIAIGIDKTTNNIIAVYENGGHIYMNVYGDLLQPATVTVPLFGPFGYLLLASLMGFFGYRRLRA